MYDQGIPEQMFVEKKRTFWVLLVVLILMSLHVTKEHFGNSVQGDDFIIPMIAMASARSPTPPTDVQSPVQVSTPVTIQAESQYTAAAVPPVTIQADSLPAVPVVSAVTTQTDSQVPSLGPPIVSPAMMPSPPATSPAPPITTMPTAATNVALANTYPRLAIETAGPSASPALKSSELPPDLKQALQTAVAPTTATSLTPANAVSDKAAAIQVAVEKIRMPPIKSVNDIHPYFNCSVQAADCAKYDDVRYELREIKRKLNRDKALMTQNQKCATSISRPVVNRPPAVQEVPQAEASWSPLAELSLQKLQHDVQNNTTNLRQLSRNVKEESRSLNALTDRLGVYVPDPVASTWY